MSTVDAVHDVSALAGPYVGLNFYTQENAAIFFGRDRERTVLISNLRAARLTLLYAKSGTGKSSLLRAGVAARLAELAQHGLDQRGTARNIPVVFSSWRDDPTAELMGEIHEAIGPFLTGASPAVTTSDRLDAAIEAASRATDATLLVILDQFEEYLIYRSREARDRPFADELAACINRADLRAKFLISIREDAYFALGDLFKGRISNVYGNYFHLEHLTREAAREAIEKPIASFNELHPGQAAVQIEPVLVGAVLDQFRPDQLALDQGGAGRLAGGDGDEPRRDEVEASYLQLVMKRLWDVEQEKHSATLRLETLEELGGAQTIVRTHVDRALEDLPDQQRTAAVAILRHLVTPSRTKIALTESDLVEYVGSSPDETNAVLERLADSKTRILRPVPPPHGQVGGTRFEISHDLLAPAILDWDRRQKAVRLEQEKDAAERRAWAERRRARRSRATAIVLALLTVLAAAASALALSQRAAAIHERDDALFGQLIVQSGSSLADTNPALAKLESIAAWRIDPSGQARDVMLNAATLSGIATLDDKNGAVGSVAFSPNGKTLAIGDRDGTVRLWDLATGQPIGGPLNSKDGAVSSVAFSPNGKILAVVQGNGLTGSAGVWLWDVGARRQIGGVLSADSGTTVSSVAFSPDGKTLAIGPSTITGNGASGGGTVQLWDVATRSKIRDVSSSGDCANDSCFIAPVAFSPDGKTLAGGGLATKNENAAVWLWNVATGHQIGSVLTPAISSGPGEVTSVAFSRDGKTLAAGGDDGRAAVWLWNVHTGHQVGNPLTVPGGLVSSVAFSPDGKTLATGGDDGTARLWDVATRRQVGSPLAGGGGAVTSVAFSPDGKTLASGAEDGTAQLWDVGVAMNTSTGTPVAAVADDAGAVAFSPDGKTLAGGGLDSNGNAAVWLWNVATGHQTADFGTDGGEVTSVAFSPDGKTLATGNGTVISIGSAAGGGPAQLWDVATHWQTGVIANGSAADGTSSVTGAVAFSPDGKTLAVGGLDGNGNAAVWLWNVPGGHQMGSVLTPAIFGVGGGVTSVAFSRDGKTLAVGGFSDINGNHDGAVWLWNVATGHQAGDFLTGGGVTSVAFSPDGTTLAIGGNDGTARLWDVATRRQVGNPLIGGGPVTSVAFSPDGKTLAVGGTDNSDGDGSVQLWDVATGEQTGGSLTMQTGGSLFVGADAVTSVAFSPDGKILAAADGHGPARLWDVAYLANPIPYLCASAGRFITPTEWAENVPGIPYQSICPMKARSVTA